MTKLQQPTQKRNHEALQMKLNGIIEFVTAAVDTQVAAHEVEERLWRKVLEIGRESLGMFFDLHGDGDEGEQVTLADGHTVNRLEHRHDRGYLSVFGEFQLSRTVYGTREGQKIEYIPLDSRLQLPGGKVSYLLEDWNQSMTLEMPFSQVSATMEKILGLRQSVHSLQRSGRQMAEQVPAFWEAQPIVPPEEEGELLICSADGKGVPMRQSSEPACIDGASDKGMRAGSKKMALIGSVYTIEAYPRTPEEVLDALFRKPTNGEERPGPHPKPCAKHVRAALMRDAKATTAPQVETIFSWMAKEALERTSAAQRPLILLMDGQDSLWTAGFTYLSESDFEVTEILDLIHAVSYLWQAVHLFHRPGSEPAFKLAKKQLRRLLSGDIGRVIRSLRAMAARRALSATRCKSLEKICNYFCNNAQRMAYDKYLADGYPIASGVIEGACRTVASDRMERSGMRWVIDGAHAMLGLRSIRLSSLWDDFIQFRIAQQSRCLYPDSAANDDDFSILRAA